MTVAQRKPRSRIGGFFAGLGELVAFALTVIGALAAFLVGHWDVEQPPARSAEGYEPPSFG